MLKVGVQSIDKDIQHRFTQALARWFKRNKQFEIDTCSLADTDLVIDYNLKLQEILKPENFENQTLLDDLYALSKTLWEDSLKKLTDLEDNSFEHIYLTTDLPIQTLLDSIALLLINSDCSAQFFANQTEKINDLILTVKSYLSQYALQTPFEAIVFCVLPRDFFSRLTAKRSITEAKFNVLKNFLLAATCWLNTKGNERFLSNIPLDTIDYLYGRFSLRKPLSDISTLVSRLSAQQFLVKVPEVEPKVFSYLTDEILSLMIRDFPDDEEEFPPQPPFGFGMGGSWII